MFGVLIGIGINQPRGTSIKTWCYGYLAIALIFDALVVVGLIYQYASLVNLLLGLSAGAATGLAIHVAHHISEEDGHDEKTETKEKNLRCLVFETSQATLTTSSSQTSCFSHSSLLYTSENLFLLFSPARVKPKTFTVSTISDSVLMPKAY